MSGHGLRLQPHMDEAVRGALPEPCGTLPTMLGPLLVARLHVDLQRVASCVCSPAR